MACGTKSTHTYTYKDNLFTLESPLHCNPLYTGIPSTLESPLHWNPLYTGFISNPEGVQ